MEEIKPCPFCGGEGKVMRVRIGLSDCWLPFARHSVACPMDCLTHDEVNAYVTKESAVEAWNTRYERTTPADELLCRHCGYSIVYKDDEDTYTWDFCPHCGARIVD